MELKSRKYFLANVCHVCKSKNTSCTCEICGMIFYCTAEHRRSDWFDHSRLCWAINKICEGVGSKCLWELRNGKDFTKFKHEVARKCTELLKRSLELWEFEMIYHPRVCNVCGVFDWRVLSFCKNCEFVYSCEKRHFRKDHEKWCNTLKLYSELIIHQTLGEDVGVTLSEFQIKTTVFESMAEVLSQSTSTDEYKNVEIQKALISEILTYPLTVLTVLRKIKAPKKRIGVLFIGAEVQAEIEPLSKWENFFLHLMEDVKELNLTFLGPELRMTTQKWSGTLCDTCRKQGRKLKFECVSGMFYHEYMTPGTKQPDMVCAFNSGMYRDFGFGNVDSWKETIQALFARGNPPVLITEYTSQELNMVLQRIENLCGDVSAIVPVEVNPFASLKPGLNIIPEEQSPVIFKNYYHSLLVKK